jgi:hypothetical protein
MQQDEEEDQNWDGWVMCLPGPEKDANKRMERQSKGSRGLEAYCKGGQGPPTPGCTATEEEEYYITRSDKAPPMF